MCRVAPKYSTSNLHLFPLEYPLSFSLCDLGCIHSPQTSIQALYHLKQAIILSIIVSVLYIRISNLDMMALHHPHMLVWRRYTCTRIVVQLGPFYRRKAKEGHLIDALIWFIYFELQNGQYVWFYFQQKNVFYLICYSSIHDGVCHSCYQPPHGRNGIFTTIESRWKIEHEIYEQVATFAAELKIEGEWKMFIECFHERIPFLGLTIIGQLTKCNFRKHL